MEWWRKVGGARDVCNGLAGQGQGRPELLPHSLWLRGFSTSFLLLAVLGRNLRCPMRSAVPN